MRAAPGAWITPDGTVVFRNGRIVVQPAALRAAAGWTCWYCARHGLFRTAILLTHHHDDHVSDLDEVRRQFPDVPVLIHELERPDVPGATGTMAPLSTTAFGNSCRRHRNSWLLFTS